MRPLEEDFRATLDAIARRHGWPTTEEPARLAALVARLSATYNDTGAAAPATGDLLAARLLFSFPRDVPKAHAAVRELSQGGLLRAPLRVLDVGAGLGATTWGLARALAAGGRGGPIQATWLDPDARALELGREVLRARGGLPLEVEARGVAADHAVAATTGRFDVVLLGQVLSELERATSAEARVARHAALVGELLARRVEDDGALVVIEPALRDRTRHLHRVRDAVLAAGAGHVFAPCLHAASCPMLASVTDWCHEDLAVDLPPWLVPVARSAGLRWQGLTFSYLVLRRDGRRAADGHPGALRAVSAVLRTKGKREVRLCGDAMLEGPRAPRVVRLDRDARPINAAWNTIARGDLVVVQPPLRDGEKRIAPTTSVAVVLAAQADGRIDGGGDQP